MTESTPPKRPMNASTLRPTAKTFVFNTAAPVWTPAKPPTGPCIVSPTSTSHLKLAAKPFIPSVNAPTFIPAALKHTVEEHHPTIETTTTPTPPSPSTSNHTVEEHHVSSPTTCSSSTSDPDDPPPEESDETPAAAVSESEIASESDSESDSASASPRRIYPIPQLLALEPHVSLCPIPLSVQGLVIATPSPTKALSNALIADIGYKSTSPPRSTKRPPRSRDTAPALEDCQPLAINESTRWKPPSHAKSRLEGPVALTPPVVLKAMTAILNKLSIDKFPKLSDQLVALTVQHLDVVDGLIDLVLAKAQLEWPFATMYAALCVKLCHPGGQNPPAATFFRKRLLFKCQQAFERTNGGDRSDALEFTSPDEQEEHKMLLKRRSLGHIRFVGELYKQKLVSGRIMHECIAQLFGNVQKPEEDKLECLCNLLSTIGASLARQARDEPEKRRIESYYATIEALSTVPDRLSTRVRFMLQDLLELRRNQWIARRKETKAMTLAQVHAEVAREEKEKEKEKEKRPKEKKMQRSYSLSSNGTTGVGSTVSDKMRRNQGPGKVRATSNVDAEGWETVTSGGRVKSKGRSYSDRGLMIGGGGVSSGGGGRRNNPFASLSTMERKDKSKAVTLPPRTQSCVRDEAVRTVGNEEAMTEERFEKQLKSIFEEFVALQDEDEVVKSVAELGAVGHYPLIPTVLLMVGMEKDASVRRASGALLVTLMEKKMVTTENMAHALAALLDTVEDLELDIPMALAYLSVMVAPLLVKDKVRLDELKALATHLCRNGKAATFVGHTLREMTAMGGERRVMEVVTASNVDFRLLLAETKRRDEDVDAFYEEYGLRFLV